MANEETQDPTVNEDVAVEETPEAADTEATETEATSEASETDAPIEEELDAKELYDALQNKTNEADELLDKLQRLKAEYTNYQNRVARDREAQRQMAIQSFATDIFTVMDNFAMAIDSIKDVEVAEELKNFVMGVEMTQTQLLDTLKKRGVEEVNPIDGTFDPKYHEALTMIEGEEDGKIMQVVRTGYKIEERILRAAQVIVAKGPAKAEDASEEKAEDTSEAADESSEN